MNSSFIGKLPRRLTLAAATGLLVLVVLVHWHYLLPWNFSQRVQENVSTGAPWRVEEQAFCPPIQRNPGRNGEDDSSQLTIIQPTNPCVRCDTGRSPNDGRWYNFSLPSNRLLLYSATFDDRPGLSSSAVIRIIGIAEPAKTWRLHCLLHHDHGVTLTPVDPSPLVIGSGWKLDGTTLVENIFTCSAGNVVPFAVSIVGVEERDQFVLSQEQENLGVWSQMEVTMEPVQEPSNGTVTSCMPVQMPARQAKRDDFAVCVPVAYRSIDPYRLIEWFELQRILGVSRVGVSHIGLNGTALTVLEHYRREGFLDLRRTEYLTSKPDPDHRRLHSTPTINDCVLRHMYQFNWILVLDFDEFLLPRRHKNLRELVQYLDTKQAVMGHQPATSYVFRNDYFFFDVEPDQAISTYLAVLRYRDRAPVSAKGYSVKSMINPRACSRMHNHACWGRLAGYSKYANDVDVDVEYGLNQHYKKCHLSKEECRRMLSDVTRDDVMLRFQKKLTAKVRGKVKTIMGHDI